MAAGVVVAVVEFTRDEVVLADRGRYVGVRFARGVPEGAPGAPALPWRKFLIVVPPGARPGDVEIRSVEYGLLAEPVLVEPIQPVHRSSLAPLAREVPPDPAIYESGVARPGLPARLVAVRRLGHYWLVEVTVCPVRYLPRSGRLELVTHLELALSYEAPDQGGEPVDAADELAYVSKVAERVRRMVINPADVDLFGPPIDPSPSGPRTRRLTQVEHVIVTNDNLSGSFALLAKWRSQLGLSSRVVLRGDILSNQVPDTGGAIFNHASGHYDGGTRDGAEAIRNFIKWAVVHWNTDFVLLGGDTDVIPERHALATLDGKLDAGGDFQNPDIRKWVGGWPQASTEMTGAPATNVMVDNVGVWECTTADADPWIRLEMRPRRPINHLKLVWGASHATGWRVAVSDDATTWTEVHSTTAGAGGTVEIRFSCVMATFVRLQVTSGTGFALEEMAVFGPAVNSCTVMPGGTATRVYLDYGLQPNPTNDPELDRLLFYDGPFPGSVIPYDEHADDTVLGWHFIDDLLAPNPAVSPTATMCLEIRGPAENHGHTQVVAAHDLNLIPADLYYGDVGGYPPSTEHDWDTNRNLVYGEQYGGGLDRVNGLADVYV
ncbi:MAG TPA: discoidin domain-containing protein, partial [Propionibacteriaceae bacterium]|nr:discoidin domain-containing protein [Propionibacteriaceae bacterium]